jgi:hypothetical protein
MLKLQLFLLLFTRKPIVLTGMIKVLGSFAMGYAGIKELYVNTLAIGTVETTMCALRLLGRRYLGWIGVAIMLYDFQDCMGE